MPPGLPIGLHHESPPRNISTHYPRATSGDLSLFRSLILDQTDAAIIRGMERTMNVVGRLAYRAGPGPEAPFPPRGPTFEEAKGVGDSLPGSMEAGLDYRASSPRLGWIFEKANVADCGIAASEEVERMHDHSVPPRTPNTRSSSFGGKPGSLGNQTLRQRSNTDRRRYPISNQVTPPARPDSRPKPNLTDSGGEISLPIDQLSMLLDAEAIGRLMVAAGQHTLRSSRQYIMLPEHQEGHTSRKAAPYRKDLDHWLGSDVRSLPDIMNRPAFAHRMVQQGSTQPLWRVPSATNTELKPAGVHMSGNNSSRFERFANLKGNPAAEQKLVEGKKRPPPSRTGHPATKSIPSMPQDSNFESEHAARLVMLQRRRQDVDRPRARDSNAEYPDEEELKVIQRDIRARTVQGWVREERRGTWYGYGLGV